ncbi:MAG: nitrilase-related carbon-nitrogen hydrolase, partial [Bacteroidota bacterium]
MAQINSTVGDFGGNVAKIVAAIQCSKEASADIVTFPELAVCGYPPEDLLLKPSFPRDNRDAIDEIAEQTEGIASLVGFADAANGRVYNSAALISNGQLVNTYHKVELPNYGVFDEKRYFSSGSGSECVPFEVDGVIITVNICEDIWIVGSTAEYCARKNNVGVVLNISASPFHAGKLLIRRDNIVAGFAKRTGTFVCHNNLVGGQDELVFDGGSLIVNPQGEIVASAKRFEEDFLVTDIETDRFAQGGSVNNSLSASVQRIVLKSRGSNERKSIPGTHAPELGRLEEIYKALVLGTRDYVRKNGFEKVVIG